MIVPVIVGMRARPYVTYQVCVHARYSWQPEYMIETDRYIREAEDLGEKGGLFSSGL